MRQTQPQTDFIEIGRVERSVSIEYQWVGVSDPSVPLMIFLHEGLGSVSMWRDFPHTLCIEAGCRGLVYSRPGYGKSTPRVPEDQWAADFMHRQAHEVLPDLLAALGIDAINQSIWLFGHSDGGSIALLYAARFPQQLAGLIVLAPHIMVEDISIENIQLAKQAYGQTDLREKLGKHHNDPDSIFWGWNNIWLSSSFRDWSIEDEIEAIQSPVLAVQGLDDEYGTLEQIHGIARRIPQTRLLELADCRHSPHRDQPGQIVKEVINFMKSFAA